MAYNIILFHYIPGKSILHTTHPGIKLISILMFCILIVIVEFPAIFLLLAIEFLCIYLASLKIGQLFREFRRFIIFMIVIFLFRIYSPGTNTLFAGIFPLPSLSEIYAGGLVITRLSMVIIFGVLLTSTTTINEMHNGLFLFLYKIPFFPAARVATLITLTIGSIPLLLDKLHEVDEARNARCIQGNRNPVYHITSFTLPLLIHVIQQTDHIAEAMEARCYTESNRPEFAVVKKEDFAILFFSLSIGILSLVINFVLPWCFD